MSVILETEDGSSLKVNAWNWGVLHYALSVGEVLEEETLVPLRSGNGTELSAEEVSACERYLTDTVLPQVPPGHRMLFDLTVTDEPDDGTFHRDDLEKNYSLQHEVLTAVIGFLKEAKGAVSVF